MATRVLVLGRVPWKLDLRAQQPLYALEMTAVGRTIHLECIQWLLRTQVQFPRYATGHKHTGCH